MKSPGMEVFLDGDKVSAVEPHGDTPYEQLWFLQTSETQMIPSRSAKNVPVWAPHLKDGTVALIEPQHL